MGAPKTIQDARANFEQAIPNIGSRYEAGVKKADWQSAAASDAAEKNYAEGVSKAISAKRRQTKVKGMSNADWQAAAVSKGSAIIGERVRQSLDKWQTNFSPIYDRVVAELPRLPARTTDFRSNIQNRLVKVVETWKIASGKM